MKNLYIYSLMDPRDQEIKYIGRTIQSLNKRLESHLSHTRFKNKSKQFKSDKEKWISELISLNLKPIIEEVDFISCNERDIPIIEDYWIEQFKIWGFKLNNSSLNTYGNTFIQSKRIKIIYQYDLNGNFIREIKNFNEYARINNLNINSIGNITRAAKRNKAFNNYLWSYEKKDLINKYKKELIIIKLLCYNKEGNFISEFNSAREAAKVLNISYKHISSVAKGKRAITENYIFKYYSDNYPIKIEPYKSKNGK